MNLVSPCSYQGGKQRVAKEIVDYMLNSTFVTNDTKFYDLCCGSGAITIELLNRGIPPDTHIYILVQQIRKEGKMVKLYLKGYLCKDHNGIIALSDENPNDYKYSWKTEGYSIINSIESFADDYGMTGEHHKRLGGRRAFIDDCNLRAYFTDKECELEEAMIAMDMLMYGGDIKTRVDQCGDSEWTFTGLDLEEFSIGGHDLKNEFNSHIGEYCHLIIEC